MNPDFLALRWERYDLGGNHQWFGSGFSTTFLNDLLHYFYAPLADRSRAAQRTKDRNVALQTAVDIATFLTDHHSLISEFLGELMEKEMTALMDAIALMPKGDAA